MALVGLTLSESFRIRPRLPFQVNLRSAKNQAMAWFFALWKDRVQPILGPGSTCRVAIFCHSRVHTDTARATAEEAGES